MQDVKHTTPKVSVVVPVYNVEKYIERCSRSLFEQTLDDIEYIFVDDCSPDNSIAILLSVISEYPHRKNQVSIIRHDVNKGLTNARNSGIAVANGIFIAHCDSDDWVEPTMYEELYDKAQQTSSDVVFCNILMVYNTSIAVFDSVTLGDTTCQTLNNYIKLPWTCTVNMIVHRALYKENYIWAPQGVSYCEDYHLTVRLLYFAKKIEKIDKAFYCYNRMSETSILHSSNTRFLDDRCWCDEDIISFFDKRGALHEYEASIAYRVLNYKQYWIDKLGHWKRFISFCPELHKYISSMPHISRIRKFAMINLDKKRYLVPFIFVLMRVIKNVFRGIVSKTKQILCLSKSSNKGVN